MTSCSDFLYISWPEAGMDGAQKEASSMVGELLAVLPQVPVLHRAALPVSYFANAAQPAFEETARL